MARPSETPAEPVASAAAPTGDDPLAPAERALDRGDHAEARRLARALLGHDDPAVRTRAAALLARLRPDPVIVVVMVATGVLAAILATLYLGAH